jgi:hypothetical protein
MGSKLRLDGFYLAPLHGRLDLLHPPSSTNRAALPLDYDSCYRT